ncbi:hypothetical protein H8B02_02565 [Bradyrhizobium sp. Pear77]|uniref:hypothetical protein n=1 Tax=Bradyrhizobium altum TaxID=1571202 RepID=UPI001E440567|nr:hypothetical protein [Bradyrhizobium altum]MCC8952380.1 hypothetical protein [Bradyrhizobium altum]
MDFNCSLRDSIRFALVVSRCVLLACCGAVRQAIEEEAEPAALNLNGALAECRRGFPDQIAQAVERSSCVIKAMELARPLLPFPELLDRENAPREALAGQVQARTISLRERNVQILKLHSQILDEERNRLSAGVGKPPLVVAQWRQSNQESCGRLGGDSANCF